MANTTDKKYRKQVICLEWFKSLGKGYQTRMNAVLRAYMEAHK